MFNQQPVATFESISNGHRTELYTNVFGHLFRLPDRGVAGGFPRYMADFYHDLIADASIYVVQGPTLYHCWHVCYCQDCGGPENGRRWDHSQAAWNEHLKRVDSRDVVTFPAPTSERI